MSFLGFRPALHVLFGGCVDVAKCGVGHFALFCLYPGLHVHQYWLGGSRSCFLVLVAVPAPVGGLWFGVVGPEPAPVLAPRPRPRLYPPLPSRLDCLVCNFTTSLVFKVSNSAVSLFTMAVSWVMEEQFLAVDVARFAIASTVSCCRYLLSGRAVALCAAP